MRNTFIQHSSAQNSRLKTTNDLKTTLKRHSGEWNKLCESVCPNLALRWPEQFRCLTFQPTRNPLVFVGHHLHLNIFRVDGCDYVSLEAVHRRDIHLRVSGNFALICNGGNRHTKNEIGRA